MDVAKEQMKEFYEFSNPIEVPGVNNSYFLKTAMNEKENMQD